VIPGRFERRNWPVFQASGVRHLNAFQRGADSTYRSWSDWLSASELVESLAHVRDREAYLSACAAAELVAALSFARAHGDSTFCAAIGREIGEGSPAEQMLRGCLRIDGAIESVSGFLDVQPDELTEELNRLYLLLTGGRPLRPSPRTLDSDRDLTGAIRRGAAQRIGVELPIWARRSFARRSGEVTVP
jgi:hypothetical protein